MFMRRQTICVGSLVVASLVIAAWAGTASGTDGQDATAIEAPRYSEVCAHGHNGFNCPESLLRADIRNLQERLTALENADQ